METKTTIQSLKTMIRAIRPEELEELAGGLGLVTVDGHELSARNQALCYYQRGGGALARVGGYRQWRANGRQVAKGEHGMLIRVPVKGPKPPPEAVEEEESRPAAGRRGPRCRFAWVHVFDESQTEPLTDGGEFAAAPAAAPVRAPFDQLSLAI